MRRQIVEVDHAVGRLLSDPIFHASGKKLLAKGHQLSTEDAHLLASVGCLQVGITLLDEDEVPEEEAALRIARSAACGALEIRCGAGGRVNLVASENCSAFVDEAALLRLNRTGLISAATLPNFSFAFAGQRISTITSAPFGVPRDRFQAALQEVESGDPLIQARPIRSPRVAVLYSDPKSSDRARSLYEGIMRSRLDRFGAHAALALASIEEERMLAHNLDHLVRSKPDVVLIASTTSPAGPRDAVGRAMCRAGGHLECFLAPVEPGNLLLLSYIGNLPIVAAPGCFRSPKPNIIDLILPPLMAGHRLSAAEIAVFGHGGLIA